MKNFKLMVASAALAVVAATAGHAATTNTAATANVQGTARGIDSLDIIFNWSSTPASAEIQIDTIGYDFDFSLLSYTTNGGPVVGQLTGFFVDRITPQTGARERLTSTTSFCANAVSWTAPGRCDVVDGTTTPGTVLLAGLTAGTYAFGFYDSANPSNGNLRFALDKVAAVPLPAGGMLLLGALGGFAALRRRKKTA